MIKIGAIQKIFVIILSAAFLFLTLINPTASKNGITNGLLLCGNVIIPSLFPFTVFSQLAYNTLCEVNSKRTDFAFLKVFRLNFSGFLILLMSLIGGYPVGAKLISKAYDNGKISRHNAEVLLPICVNAGPSFVIIAIGSAMLNSVLLGVILFVADLLACLELYLMFRNRLTLENITNKEHTDSNFAEIFVESVADSAAAVLNICAFTAVFSCIINVMQSVIKSETLVSVITYPLEISNTVLINRNIYLLAFIIGFGGICVIFQIISISKGFFEKIGKLFLIRIIHGLLAVINTAVIIKIFKITVPTISNIGSSILSLNTNNTKISIILIILALLLLISVSYKKYSGILKKDML